MQRKTKFIVSACAILVTVSVTGRAYADKCTFTGVKDDLWADPANWTAVPGSGDTVEISEGKTAVVSSGDVSNFASLAGVTIGNEAKLSVRDSSGALTVGPALPLSGSGTFEIATANAGTSVVLSGDNAAFTGSFVFSNVTVRVQNSKALGTACPIETWMPTATLSGFYGAFCYEGAGASGVYSNPIVFRNDTIWWGFFAKNCAVTNAGALSCTCTGNVAVRFRQESSGVLAFTGPVTSYGGNFILNGNVEFSGDDPVVLASPTTYIYSDEAYTTVRWGKPMAEYSLSDAAQNGYVHVRHGTWKMLKPNALINARLKLGVANNSVSFDLNGYDQIIGHKESGSALKYLINYDPSCDLTVTSSRGPATFSVSSMAFSTSWQSYAMVPFTGKLDRDVSFSMESYGGFGPFDGTWYVKLGNKVGEYSSTTGTLTSINGSIWLDGSTRLPKLSKILIGRTGGLNVTATPGELNRHLRIETTGEAYTRGTGEKVGYVALPDGVTLTVQSFNCNGYEFPVGTYDMNTPLPGNPGKTAGIILCGGSSAATTSGKLVVTGKLGMILLFR